VTVLCFGEAIVDLACEIAGLAAADWKATRAAEALDGATKAAAQACTHWGAIA